MTSLLSTVPPSATIMSDRLPSAGATTSITTLSVSISTIKSSRLHASPGCLCQVAMVPSATDSGKDGALISIDMVYLFTLIMVRVCSTDPFMILIPRLGLLNAVALLNVPTYNRMPGLQRQDVKKQSDLNQCDLTE